MCINHIRRETKAVEVTGFLFGIFSGLAKSIIMQIPFVMLLFSNQISRRGKNFQGGKVPQGVPPVEESQVIVVLRMYLILLIFVLFCSFFKVYLKFNYILNKETKLPCWIKTGTRSSFSPFLPLNSEHKI